MSKIAGAKIFITGCSRGLGVEMVKQLCKRKDGPAMIFASCRSPDTAGRLQELSYVHSNIRILQLDVDTLDDHDRVKREVERETDSLDILINNAGISPKATRINLVKAEQMTETFHTNVVAPLFLTKSFIPLLSNTGKCEDMSLIVNLSSILGSIAENTKQGGLYPYRASKSALNAITRSLSIDLKHQNIGAVTIHPGWVKTDMGGNNAPLTAEQSVRGVLALVDNFQPDRHNGNFFSNTGDQLPW